MMQLEGFQANHACQIAHVSRAGFYRHWEEHTPRQADVALRSLIQQIVLENRCYGYRRVAAELHYRGDVANRKRGANWDRRSFSLRGRGVFLGELRLSQRVRPDVDKPWP